MLWPWLAPSPQIPLPEYNIRYENKRIRDRYARFLFDLLVFGHEIADGSRW